MNFFKKIFLLPIVLSVPTITFSQANLEKMGTQAFMKSDYKTAIEQLEKAESISANHANVLKMLGYSYYQCGDYEHAITAYSRLIVLKPLDYSAYYYRGKARLNIANDPKEAQSQLRDSYYYSAIKDFSKAIEINGEEDTQIFQNRGLAYKDYAIYKSYKIKKSVDKANCILLFNNANADFQKVLTIQPLRKDIINLLDYVKSQIVSLK
jgi:tetratricopeptide (TPR) repeat protein